MTANSLDTSLQPSATTINDPRPRKRVADSYTEAVRIVTHPDVNGENRLFGGRLMEWIDETAGIAARRHCGGSVTTACVDTLQFKHPAKLNDIVVIEARVTHVGNTSLEIQVISYVEDTTNDTRAIINTAYLTEVHVNNEGVPQPVRYGLELTNDQERLEWEAAEKRIGIRQTRKEFGF